MHRELEPVETYLTEEEAERELDANAAVTAKVYAGLTDTGRELAAAKLTASGFGV